MAVLRMVYFSELVKPLIAVAKGGVSILIVAWALRYNLFLHHSLPSGYCIWTQVYLCWDSGLPFTRNLVLSKFIHYFWIAASSVISGRNKFTSWYGCGNRREEIHSLQWCVWYEDHVYTKTWWMMLLFIIIVIVRFLFALFRGPPTPW